MPFKDFLNFIRERGVVGLAVGFMLGGAISKLVAALVNDLINPLVGLLLPGGDNLADKSFHIHSATVMWGDFVKVTIDFLVVALVVYLGLRLLRIGRPKDQKKPN